MRTLLIVALIHVAVAPAFADVVVDPSWPWQERINTCVALWHDATPEQQGTMSYRQFTTKCVGGKTALPFKTKAVCSDGSASNGNASDGVCANNGGVAEWTN